MFGLFKSDSTAWEGIHREDQLSAQFTSVTLPWFTFQGWVKDRKYQRLSDIYCFRQEPKTTCYQLRGLRDL